MEKAKARTFRIRGKVWRYPGPSGWYFINTGLKVAAAVRFFEDLQKVGWGYVKVSARVGRTEWETTLFPSKENDFLLAIKASVRKSEGIREGDLIGIGITLHLVEERTLKAEEKARPGKDPGIKRAKKRISRMP